LISAGERLKKYLFLTNCLFLIVYRYLGLPAHISMSITGNNTDEIGG